jgi:hypothetical protein
MTVVLLGMTGTARAPLIYVAGIALTYTSIGLLVALGLGDALRAGLASALAPSGPRYAVELVLGLGLAGWALHRSPAPPAPARRRRPAAPRALGPMRLIGLGAAVTAVEATTAVPYVGALGLLVAAEPSWTVTVAVLLVYNALFVAPPLLLIGLHAWRRESVAPVLARIRIRLEGGGGGRWVSALAIAGAALLISDGVAGLATGAGWL